MSVDAGTRPAGGALILAAGFARRFGSDKRRHRLPQGPTLLEATLRRYAEVYQEICLVLRPGERELEKLAAALSVPVHIAISRDAEFGMGHSLAAGARRISTRWRWASVALADMPFINRATLADLLEAFFASPPGSILQPVYQSRPGHPVTFPAEYFPELAALTGDQGARPVLARHHSCLVRHPVDDPGVLQDVDLPSGPATWGGCP